MEQNQLQRDNLSLAINWYEEQPPNGKALIYKNHCIWFKLKLSMIRMSPKAENTMHQKEWDL